MDKPLLVVSDFQTAPEFFRDIYHLYTLLVDLRGDYPGFTPWYFDTVVPGVQHGDREIVVAGSEREIHGIAIVKNTLAEKKVSTLWVAPPFRKAGIGKALLIKSFDLLDTQHPLMTIPQRHVPQFQSLLDYFGFELSDILPNYYRQGQDEHVFNGFLTITRP